MLDVPEVIDDCPVVQGGFTLDVPLDDIEPITPPDDIELVLDHNTADDIELEMNKEPEVDDTVFELDTTTEPEGGVTHTDPDVDICAELAQLLQIVNRCDTNAMMADEFEHLFRIANQWDSDDDLD